jgi:hypothetical protein
MLLWDLQQFMQSWYKPKDVRYVHVGVELVAELQAIAARDQVPLTTQDIDDVPCINFAGFWLRPDPKMGRGAWSRLCVVSATRH